MTDDDLAAIAGLISAGDDQQAFTRLRARMSWPRGKDLPELAAWVKLLGELAQRRDSTTLTELSSAVVRDPDSPDRLYDLGYALIDAGTPGIAATVLWRC